MLKLLVIVTLLSSSLCLNPGVYGFVSRKSIGAFKDSAWPKVQGLLSNIQIPGQQDIDVGIGHLNLSGLHVQINLESNAVNVDLDGGSNMIKVSANNINFSGGGHWQLKTFIYSPDGDLTFNGNIGNLQANVIIDNQQKTDGLVPKIAFNAITISNINNLNIQVTNSGLAPIMNLLTSLQKGIIETQIQQQLSNNGSLQNDLSNLLNQQIFDNYPVAIPISQFGIAVSTYTTGPIKVYNNGLEVPAEGFTYAISSGYKKNPFCKEMHSYINPDIVISDFYAAAGDCTLQSGADAQTEAGFKYEIKQPTSLGDIEAELQLNRWDGQSFEFYQDNVKATVLIAITGKISNGSTAYNIKATTNAVVNVKQAKKSTSNQVHAQSPDFSQISSGLTDGILASIDVAAKIEKLDNWHVEGIPDFLGNILKNAILAENYTTSFDVPQFCIADKVCFNSFNAGIREGYIQADANVEFRPLREEIS